MYLIHFGEHEKHSDGSCTTYLYEADKCTKCGNRINEELTNKKYLMINALTKE